MVIFHHFFVGLPGRVLRSSQNEDIHHIFLANMWGPIGRWPPSALGNKFRRLEFTMTPLEINHFQWENYGKISIFNGKPTKNYGNMKQCGITPVSGSLYSEPSHGITPVGA